MTDRSRLPYANGVDEPNRAGNDAAGPAVAVGIAAALGALALFNNASARAAERRHPPRGRFVRVDGPDGHDVRLHALDTGEPVNGDGGPPVVLLHGNVVTSDDWMTAGIMDRLDRRRVIAFDRPGFGHSERPRGVRWGAREQAALFIEACERMGVRRPVVVGHSWGTLPALAWALEAPETITGAVLLSGYYYPTTRVDGMFAATAAVPVLGDLLRHTVSPPFMRATLGAVEKGLFDPREVPDRFSREFPHELTWRPGQLRAIASEGAIMVDEAEQLQAMIARSRRGPSSPPLALMAGLEDKVVDPHDQTARLARELANTTLELVPGTGHMVHHAVPETVRRMVLGMGSSGNAMAAPGTALEAA